MNENNVYDALKGDVFRENYVLFTRNKMDIVELIFKTKGIKLVKEETEENLSGDEEYDEVISSAKTIYADKYNTDIDVPEDRTITPFFSKAELINNICIVKAY